MESDPYPFWVALGAIQSFMPTDYILLCCLLACILINALVSGAEVAFFSLNESDVFDSHATSAPKKEAILQLIDKPSRLLSSIVMAYNAINIIIITLTVILLNRFPLFNQHVMDGILVEIIIALAIILLFVEILPKIIAQNKPLSFASSALPVIGKMVYLFTPLSGLLASLSSSSPNRRSELSMDDLSKALELTSDEIIESTEKEMLEGIIRFKDKTADDILVSRSNVVAINIDSSFRNVINSIVEAGFSRIPVYADDIDSIQGLLYVKDLIRHIDKPDTFQWQTLIRPAYFVPGTKPIDDLLEEFRTNKNHMAIVVDEYGGTAGIVTMEDILEEIVGDISDEYDEETQKYTLCPDGSFLFEGNTSLEDFVKITDVDEKDFEKLNAEIDTMAGMLLELNGDFPSAKQIITYKQYTFQAEELNQRRITKVRYIPASHSNS